MIRNHGIVPKKSRSAAEYYRTHQIPEEPNYYLIAAGFTACFVLGVLVGRVIWGM